MGWFEVINTVVNVAHLGTSISLASNIGKMQRAQEANVIGQMQLSEIIDIGDRIKRKIKKLNRYMADSPQSVLVLSNFYETSLRSLGLIPSAIPSIEARPLFRDLFEDMDDLSYEAKKKLSSEEIEQADRCLQAIIEMPNIEMALNDAKKRSELENKERQAKEFLQLTEEEWNKISAQEIKSNNKKSFGIGLLGIAVIQTCLLPLVVPSLFSGIINQDVVSSPRDGTPIIEIIIYALLYIILIGLGIYLIVKGKNTNRKRYIELENNRNQAKLIISTNFKPVNNNPEYQNKSWEELHFLYLNNNKLINSILGKIGNPQKLLTDE